MENLKNLRKIQINVNAKDGDNIHKIRQKFAKAVQIYLNFT